MPNCFVIMPITTPSLFLSEYNDDDRHFMHVLDHLFIPAIKNIKYSPITPIMKGADLIHAEIIKNLGEADLVLCDMSILNPNVFFELGIRTALDKPVCLVKDSRTKKVPFDTSIINYHTYNHELHPWNLKDEIPKLESHLTESIENSNQQNTLWRYFGLTQPGNYEQGSFSVEEKLDFLIKEVAALEASSINTVNEGEIPSQEILRSVGRNQIEKIIEAAKADNSQLGKLLRNAAKWALINDTLFIGFANSSILRAVEKPPNNQIISNAVWQVLGPQIAINTYYIR